MAAWSSFLDSGDHPVIKYCRVKRLDLGLGLCQVIYRTRIIESCSNYIGRIPGKVIERNFDKLFVKAVNSRPNT